MLKLIALVLMTLDHIGAYLDFAMPAWLSISLRFLGRLAFPIFAYSVALGYRRTRNYFRYGLRLLAWGFIAEVIMRYARSLIGRPSSPNVLFTLCLGVVFLSAYELFCNANYDRLVRMDPIQESPGEVKLPHQYRFNMGFEMSHKLGMILGSLFMALSLFAAYYFDTDYGAYGVITIFLYHLVLKKEAIDRLKTALLYLSFFNLMVICTTYLLRFGFRYPSELFNLSYLQGFSVLANFLIFRLPQKKSTERPPLWQKYFFYLYYPLHLLIICWIGRSLLY